MELILCSVGGYFVGCINPAYFIAKAKGFDIRTRGTGNAGATNAVFSLGFKTGLLVMLIDVLKAFFSVRIAKYVFAASSVAGIVAGIFCAIGHIFPFYMNFHGGKGTACLGGIILALTPRLLMPMLVGVMVIGLVIDYASILPLIGAAAYPILYYAATGSSSGALLLALMFPLMLWTHRKNFAKHRNGEESSFRSVILKRDLDDCVERKGKSE
ncbi:MAG: glycerol-3-phosphate acyltransferase [Clostridia bacterium]|nr:glycerol-3-phosphate acyltransferase [Clostridia bacterium]